jgi:hypothetical protein
MRATLYRLLIAVPAAAALYCGQYWANRTGGGCAPGDEDHLAVLGAVITVLAIAALASALLRRWVVGAVSAGIGIVLTVIGFGIAIRCLQ